MIVFLVSVMVALSVSFFCSLAEAALLSLTPTQIAEISSRRPRLAAVWQDFKAHIERPIAVILILNTAAHTIGASVAGAYSDQLFGRQWIWLFSLVFTCLMLQFTEIMPKNLGVRYNRELAAPLARPLSLAIAFMAPLIRVAHWVNRPFEAKRDGTRPSSTLEEISALAGLARLSNLIGAQQEKIIKAASRLSQMRMRQVMIPVEQVAFVSTSQTLLDAVVATHLEAHTRYPVCEDNDHDRIAGYVNFKEMIYYMRTNPGDPSLRGIVRPIHFASPDQSAAELLRTFTDQHVHIAMVRDPSGRTLGMVTLEDLVEELLGELEDEFDRLPRMLHPLSGGTWMAGGGLPIGELVAKLGLSLPDAQGTVASWIGQRLGHAPKPGDVFRQAGMEFFVRRVRRGKVFEVAVTRQIPVEHSRT
jgi:CBS domain containing-hemolysin-like protein